LAAPPTCMGSLLLDKQWESIKLILFGNTNTIRRMKINSPDKPPRRRHYGYESTRRAILDAARAIMREEGIAALSLHEVARRIGMKTPSLYTYFDNKNALYDALFALGMKMYRDYTNACVAQTTTIQDELEVTLTAYMRFADENPDLYPLLFERPVPGFVPSPAAMVDISELAKESRARVQRAIDAGDFETDLSAAQTQNLFLALMHGLTALKRANEPDTPIGQGRFGSLIPAATDMLIKAWFPKRRSSD